MSSFLVSSLYLILEVHTYRFKTGAMPFRKLSSAQGAKMKPFKESESLEKKRSKSYKVWTLISHWKDSLKLGRICGPQ